MRLQEVSLVSTDYANGRDVAQTSKSAVSRISKSAEPDSASTDCRFGNLRYGGAKVAPYRVPERACLSAAADCLVLRLRAE